MFLEQSCLEAGFSEPDRLHHSGAEQKVSIIIVTLLRCETAVFVSSAFSSNMQFSCKFVVGKENVILYVRQIA